MSVLRAQRTTRRKSGPSGGRLLLRRLSLLLLVAVIAYFVAVITYGLLRGTSGSHKDGFSQEQSEAQLPVDPPKVDQYRSLTEEVAPLGKELTARVAQDALTYSRGESVRSIARRLSRSGAKVAPGVIRDGYVPGSRSWAKVIYPQMSGYTGDTMGAMVVVTPTTENQAGERSNQTRVIDVRLQLENGTWQLSELASVGGTPNERPPGLPVISQRVLDDPAIDLPDSARWDIYRGEISENLLEALADAAKSNPIRVAVLKTGHPPTVWGTSNPSAHSEGLAADIWSVAGQPVVEQRQTGSAAFDTAGAFVLGGALQVGSPWTFTSDGFSTFTDDVHQDHIHVQP